MQYPLQVCKVSLLAELFHGDFFSFIVSCNFSNLIIMHALSKSGRALYHLCDPMSVFVYYIKYFKFVLESHGRVLSPELYAQRLHKLTSVVCVCYIISLIIICSCLL